MNMKLSEIKISTDFESSTPSTSKYAKCEKYYNETGNQDRYIVVDENNVLVDGYIMYIVLKSHDVEYGNTKRMTLRKHKYTDRQRNRYGKLVPQKKVISYKDKRTTYVYGKHPNDINGKEYVWRIPSNWTDMNAELRSGDLIYCWTKFGVHPVIVTRIETKDHFDTNLKIKKVWSKIIVRKGESLKVNKDGAANV